MTTEEIVNKLVDVLKTDDNVYNIGVIGNNVESYKENPSWFVREIKEDSLIVYTKKLPTKTELEMTEFEGLKVTWKKMGKLRAA